jgi:hypothetical protein
MAERRIALIIVLPVLAVLLWQASFAIQVLRADPRYFSVQREVVFWADEQYRPDAARVTELQQQMRKAQELWPEQADYHALQARLQTWQGLLADSRQAASENFAGAAATMELALRWRPANPWSLAQYAEYLATQPARRAELEQVAERALRLAPGDAGLQTRMSALLSR